MKEFFETKMEDFDRFVKAVETNDWDLARSIYKSTEEFGSDEVEPLFYNTVRSGDIERGLKLMEFVDKEAIDVILDEEVRKDRLEFLQALILDPSLKFVESLKSSILLLAERGNWEFLSILPDSVIQELGVYIANVIVMKVIPEQYTDLEERLLTIADLSSLFDNTRERIIEKYRKLEKWDVIFTIYSNRYQNELFDHTFIEDEKPGDFIVELTSLIPIQAFPEIAEKHHIKWTKNPNLSAPFRILLDFKYQSATDAEKPELDEIKNQYFYPSGRPRTTMSFIPVPLKSGIPSGIKLVEGRSDNLLISDLEIGSYDHLLIPILRYASGMSRGAYHTSETKSQYCGTFYYFDIGSEFLLDAGRVLVARNKLHACSILSPDTIKGVKLPDPKFNKIKDFIEGNYLKEIFDEEDHSQLIFDENGIDENGEYYDQMYAFEDKFDQPLCHAAKGKYDCVILLRMFGQNRIVTEVLDVRDRIKSFDNIYRR